MSKKKDIVSGANKFAAQAEQEKLDKSVMGDGSKEKLQQTESRDAMDIVYYGREIKTVDELIESAGVDLTIWEVAEATVNQWEVKGKRSLGQDDQGKHKGEEIWGAPLRQIKIKLRRKAPKPIQDGIRELLADLKPPKLPKAKRVSNSDPHLLELALVDAHFGKLCWGEQTGTDYDLDIAYSDYVGAVDDLLSKVMAAGFKVERVLMPLGNDFYHVDNWLGTTHKGTYVDSVDDRFQKVFRVGCQAVEYAVTRCREIADVEVLWVPGNHDRSTSWYMVEWVDGKLGGDAHIHVNNSAKERKYRLYGPSLLGYAHSDEIKMNNLPLLMATDVPDLWAQATYRHWRCGHWHKKKELWYTAGDAFNGVQVTVLPSISGTDKWHYDKGFVNVARTAEASLWSKHDGYTGHFSVGARSARQ